MVYTDRILSNYVIRTFSDKIDREELQWHRDQESRIVKAISNTDWKIQMENDLPISLNDPIFIRKEKWHRLIKGTGELKLEIIKIDE